MRGYYQIPMSMPQREMFLSCIRDDSLNAAYNLSITIDLSGELDRGLLQQALDLTIARHEALRIVSFSRGGTTQEIAENRRVMIEEVLLGPGKDQEDRLVGLLHSYMRQPFLLEGRRGFVACRLITLALQSSVLHLMVHHLTVDGIGIGVVLSDFAELYSALRGDRECRLQPAPTFRQHVEMECQYLESSEADMDFSFWAERAGEDFNVLSLVSENPNLPPGTSAGLASKFLDRVAHTQLETAALREGVSLFVLLQAAFQIFVSRWCGKDDAFIGLQFSTRQVEEAQLVGHCVSLLPIRAAASQNLSFRAYLSTVRREIAEAIDHRRITFGSLCQRFPATFGRTASHGLRILFNIDPFVPAPNFSGLHASVRTFYPQYLGFDLDINISRQSDSSRWDLLYTSSRMTGRSAERFLSYFMAFVQELCNAPLSPTREFSIVPSLERATLALESPTGGFQVPSKQSVIADLECIVRRYPENIALVHEKNKITFVELWKRVEQAVACLHERGIQRGDRVVILVPRSIDAVIWMLALVYIGGVFVPLDSKLPSQRINAVLNDACPWAIVGALSGLDVTAGVHSIPADGYYKQLVNAPSSPCSVDSDECAYTIFTSGTTGRPKGVMISHGNLRYALDAYRRAYDLDSQDVHLQMAQIGFDVFIGDVLRSLCCGATLVICPSEVLLESSKLYALIDEKNITFAEFVPAIFRSLASYLTITCKRLDRMRIVVISSDSWTIDEYRCFKNLCGETTRLINTYGVTEATIDNAHYEESQSELPRSGGMPIGRPFLNSFLYVVDECLVPLPPGVPGELCVGGAAVAQGYLNNVDLNRLRFIEDPYPPAGIQRRLYRTGDRAYRFSNGNVALIGRSDNQVKLRGLRIELGEIEQALKSHSAVIDALVVVEEGGQTLTAFVVLRESSPTIVTSLRLSLVERLPSYMLPTTFKRIASVPLTANGKRDRSALVNMTYEPLASSDFSEPPRTLLEQQLLELWQEHFGSRSFCGVQSDFYEWGGHSLAAVALRIDIEKRFAKTVPLSALLDYGTIRNIASRLESLSSSVKQTISPVLINSVSASNSLYFLHGTSLYAEVAEMLSKVSAFGMYVDEIKGKSAAMCSIEELGAFYAELLSQLGKKHLYLGGFSDAGLIAFEAAHCLFGRGISTTLVLLDAWVPGTAPDSKDNPIWNTYRPKPYNGTVHLFRAIDESSSESCSVERGWTTACINGTQLHDFFSAHQDLLSMPAAEEVAHEIEHIFQHIP